MTRLLHLLIPMMIFFNHAFGQEKYEREYRIDETEVPASAVKFVNDLRFDSKIKWIKEEGLSVSSIEAKTTPEKQEYSIEFNLNGELEDVEIELKWNELGTDLRDKIYEYLRSVHDKFHPRKVQIQYTGANTDLIEFLVRQGTSENITTKYEIVFRTKTGKKHELIEYLFSDDGQMERKSVIVFRNTDNIEY